MADIPEEIKRRRITDDLRATFEASLPQRVDRYTEIEHQTVIPGQHFAEASTECLRLYTDGYFFSAVMVTQAVAEGIRRFIVKCNGIKLEDNMDGPHIAGLLAKKEIISKACADAFDRIWKSFRDDFHHMNPKVGEIPAMIPFSKLAKRNIQDLAAIEREIFAVRVTTGAFILVNPQYWDIQEGGTAKIFLRCSP